MVSQGEEADARRFALQQAAGRSEDPYMLSAVASVLMIAGYQADAAAQSEQVNALVEDDELLTGPWDIIYGVCHDAARAALLATSGAPESARNLATRLRDYVESLQALGLGLPQANYCLAQAHAILGNAGAAFETLESSLAGGWPRCWFVRRDPAFVTLRERPEFIAIADGCGR